MANNRFEPEWRTNTFQQLIDEGVLEISDGYRAQNSELGGDGPIFLRAGHVTDTHIDFSGVERFRSELLKKLRPKMAMPGDTIITTKGNGTGRTSYVTYNLPDFVYSPHLSYWRSLNSQRLKSGFLRYWSRGPEFKRQLESMKASTDMAPYLSLTDQRRLNITLPPIDTQIAISNILGMLDDKIDLNRRMNATLDAMAQALFQSWFVDFAPVRARIADRTLRGQSIAVVPIFPSELQESVIGPIPGGWEVTPISALVKLIGGGTPQRANPSFWNGTIPWFSVRDAPNDSDTFVIDTEEKITELGLSQSSTRILPEGTTIISARGTIGKLAIVGTPMAMNQSCYGVQPSARSGVAFNYFLLQNLVGRLKQNAHGGVFDTITTSTFETVQFAVPTRSFVNAFEESVAPNLNRIKANVHQSRTLAALRDTLLPKLLSGELRVSAAEKEVARHV